MTTEDVIEILDNERTPFVGRASYTDGERREAFDIAIASLRAIQRLGKFGQLFMDNEGCPRGSAGRSASPLEKEVLSIPKIKDVDGGEWIPVNADAQIELVNRYVALAQQEQENPKSLTLDELRDMKYELVYLTAPFGIKNLVRFEGMEPVASKGGMKATFWDGCFPGVLYELYTCDYGKTWLAYLYEPKRADKP